MTDQTRETLTVLALELEKTAATCDRLSAESSTRSYRQHADRRRKEAAALRDVLTPRTCSTCRHADADSARPGWCFCAAPMRPAQVGIAEHDARYPFHHRPVPLDERCKGWQAREGEGGGR